jgi:hypothetical protein
MATAVGVCHHLAQPRRAARWESPDRPDAPCRAGSARGNLRKITRSKGLQSRGSDTLKLIALATWRMLRASRCQTIAQHHPVDRHVVGLGADLRASKISSA